MTKEFTIYSDTQPGKSNAQTELLIQIVVHAQSDVDAYANVEYILNMDTGQELNLEQLSTEDQVQVTKLADEIAYDCARDVWYEQLLNWADAQEGL